MKTRFKLLMFVLVLVVAVLCIASCGGGNGDDTTTEPPKSTTDPAASTTAPGDTTTAAPGDTTTAAPDVPTVPPSSDLVPGALHPQASKIVFNPTKATYTGTEISTGYRVTGHNNYFTATFSFLPVDANNQPIAGATPVAQPVAAGKYQVTATFDWGSRATEADKLCLLPDPIVRFFTVEQLKLNKSNIVGSTQNFETFYHDNLALDIAGTDTSASPVVSGKLKNGLNRAFKVERVADEKGTDPQPFAGTVITEEGYYKVTVTYVEPTGADNFEGEDGISHHAIVHVRKLGSEAQVLKADGITIDGVIDTPYLHSASITSRYQEGGDGKGNFKKSEGVTMGSPYEAINMVNIRKGSAVSTIPQNGVTLYALWGEEGEGADKQAFLYVAIDVKDAAVCTRSTDYLSQPDAWVNDSIELAYKLGGYELPSLADQSETYPIYSTVQVDARNKQPINHSGTTPNHTTIKQAESLYFDGIQSATQQTSTGYVVELKIPAKSESFTGTLGYDFARTEGRELTAGEFVFFAVQQNDLTRFGESDDADYDRGIPKDGSGEIIPKYATDQDIVAGKMTSEWAAFEGALTPYMYCSGNRNIFYLKEAGSGPIVFQLSNESYNIEINGTDGVKDDDYSKGNELEYTVVDPGTGEPIPGATASGIATSVIAVGDDLYIYTTVTAADFLQIQYMIGGSLVFGVDLNGNMTANGNQGDTSVVTITPAASGASHEIKIAGAAANAASVLTAAMTGSMSAPNMQKGQ